jgi:hypothetical protein
MKMLNKNKKQKSVHFFQFGHFCWTMKMSNLQKLHEVSKMG